MEKEIKEEYLQILQNKLNDQKIKQSSTLIKHIARIQQYEDKGAQFIRRPTKFLNFVKRRHFLKIKDTPNVAELQFVFLRQDRDAENLRDFLLNIKTGKMRKREVKIEHLLGIICPERVDNFIYGYDYKSCCHISCLGRGLFWVSDGRKLLLTNQLGESKVRVTGALSSKSGMHTLSKNSELIYIAKNLNINKRDNNGKIDVLIKREECEWEPLSLFCSKTNGEILVAMTSKTSESCKIVIYTGTGRCVSQYESQDYKKPIFITENTNKDIVVSDSGRCAVVVLYRKGRHRFSYKGHPPESSLHPLGICTDLLSNILVCSVDTVQMIDQNGQFLLDIIKEPFMEINPISLCYEVARDVVWVEFYDRSNTIIVYRHIDRKPALMGEFAF